MKNYLVLFLTLTLIACGPSQEEKEKIAAVSCAVMGETRNMDAAIRVEKMNEAREKIGGEPFLRGDDAIKEAFEYGLCEELVLNAAYDESLGFLKDAERERERIEEEQRAERRRIATEKRAEEERLAAEKRAEEERLAAEKRAEEERLAAEKRAEEKRREERIAAERREEAKLILADFITNRGNIDFHGVTLDFNFRIVHLDERQQGRNMEVGDKLLEIRSTPVDITLISEYLVRDFTNDPPALSVTLERNGERKTRSIRIR